MEAQEKGIWGGWWVLWGASMIPDLPGGCCGGARPWRRQGEPQGYHGKTWHKRDEGGSCQWVRQEAPFMPWTRAVLPNCSPGPWSFVWRCHTGHICISPPFAVFGRSPGCSAEGLSEGLMEMLQHWRQLIVIGTWLHKKHFLGIFTLAQREGDGDSKCRKSGSYFKDVSMVADAKKSEERGMLQGYRGLCLIQSAHLEIHHSSKYKCRCEIIPQISLQAGQEGGKSGSLDCWFLLPPWVSIAVISSGTCWKSLLVWADPQGTFWTWETTNQLLLGVSLMHRVVQGLSLWDLGCRKQNKSLDSGPHSQGKEPFLLTSVVSQLTSSEISWFWIVLRAVH